MGTVYDLKRASQLAPDLVTQPAAFKRALSSVTMAAVGQLGVDPVSSV
jgi:hypothetical protein